MAKRKNNRSLGPRRKRMRRPARLQAAVKWRSGYGGKIIVRDYTRWFGMKGGAQERRETAIETTALVLGERDEEAKVYVVISPADTRANCVITR